MRSNRIDEALYGRKYGSLIEKPSNGKCGCHGTIESDCSDSSVIALECTRALINDALKTNLVNVIRSEVGSESSEAVRLQHNVMTDRATVATFTNTRINALILPASDNYYYCINEEGGKFLGLPFLFRIFNSGNQTTVHYFTVDLEELGRLIVKNGLLVESTFGYSPQGNTLRRPGFWNNWTNCVNRNVDRFTDGSTFGAVMGIGCIAFGPSCAAGISIGCALQS